MKEKNKILLLVVYQSSINLNNCMYIIKNNNNSCCSCVCNVCLWYYIKIYVVQRAGSYTYWHRNDAWNDAWN